MHFIAENNAKVDFKGYDKMQGLIALSDSTGRSAAGKDDEINKYLMN